ncbi:MAG: hypothetical protein COV35_08745 [Alphaproteobacteria bacterium CG11_big_fil_rev_8_21_14_0_20_39_49]|nr:MAG: hypothetical protein COV35_08745 [Alphaproteobacteria bacterium CG11_big_fil_rev_8_21_14_0_20_39_49]
MTAKEKDNLKKNAETKSDNTGNKNSDFSLFNTLAKNAAYSSLITVGTYPLHSAKLRIIDPQQRNNYSNLREYYKGHVKPFYQQHGFTQKVQNSYSGMSARLIHTPLMQAVRLGLSITSDRMLGDSEDDILKSAEKSAFILAGAAILCPVETIGIATALDPKNGFKKVIDSYKESISKGNIGNLYPSSRVISATGRSAAAITSFTMGGDYINSQFRGEDGKIKDNDVYKASLLTGAFTAFACTPLELIHFWGKDAKNNYSMETLKTNFTRAVRGGSGIGAAMIPRMAITVPLVAARNMGRLEAPMEHNIQHHDENTKLSVLDKYNPKWGIKSKLHSSLEPEKSWQDRVKDKANFPKR